MTAAASTSASPHTVASLAGFCQDELAEHQQMLASSLRSLVSHGWVVVVRSPSFDEGGMDTIMATDFMVEGQKVTNPRMSSLLRCSRFTKEDATAIASGVHNGAGEQGEAMSLVAALRHKIAEIENLIASLTTLEA